MTDEHLDPWGEPLPPRSALVFCEYVAPNGLPCTSRVEGHPEDAHFTSDGRLWPARHTAEKDAVIDALTTHRHGKDRAACAWCARFYGDVYDRIKDAEARAIPPTEGEPA